MKYSREGEIATYELSEHKGRAFFTTDIHGSFDLLHEHIRDVAFNASTDLLLCGGDIVDRGVGSRYVLDYLNEPWPHSIRANHEQLLSWLMKRIGLAVLQIVCWQMVVRG